MAKDFIEKVILCIALLITLSPGDIKGEIHTPTYKKLIVGTKEALPFAIKTMNGDWEGISIDLWRQIADELELRYEFKEADLKGLIDGVSQGTFDVAVAALSITPEREKILDFTHPFYTTGLGIAISSQGGNPWLSVVQRFFSFTFLKVTLSLIFLLFVIGICIWWCERTQNSEQFGGNAPKGIWSGFWWSAVTLTTVGYGDKAPVTIGGRILAVVWMFSGIVIISSFTAAITTTLTVTHLQSQIQGPEHLSNVRVGTIPYSSSETYLRDHLISYKTYKTPHEGLSSLVDGKTDALVYDSPVLHYLANKEFKGNVEILPVTFSSQNYAIALPEGTSLREPVNRVLLKEIQKKSWEDILYKYMGR
ncbi:MAG: transporter substrate-binding domain-containing protein [Thermodesulfobacteriota bacterium]|nr:transporter substrate-binding domain-containing protein [Thermodesulfobacteriota bacterium]